MSDPARALQNLNLDEMPVTRSHTQPSRQGNAIARERGSESGSGEAVRMDPLIHSHTPSSPSTFGSQGRGSVTGLTATYPTVPSSPLFAVERVAANHATSLDFRLATVRGMNTRAAVRIQCSTGRQARASYSCTEHLMLNEPCAHIKVLF